VQTTRPLTTAFIREHSSEQWPPAGPGAETPVRATRPDIQAAVTVIGRRNPRHDRISPWGPSIDLRGAVLTHANLRNADLHGAHLHGADLTSADLLGADLCAAVLFGADLTGADLTSANLTGANLTAAVWRTAEPAPEGWMVDGDSGRLKRAGQLSEIMPHYFW
jgi:Pentapeptide repeats (8 copies)